jgi:hypothetical protein
MRASNCSVARAVAAVALGALVAACSFIVDFDRSKVHPSGTGGHSSAGGKGGTGGQPPLVDSGQGGTPETGGGSGTGGGTGGDAGGDAPATACDPKTHAGCTADELCCETTSGPACKKTSLDECESCGTACPEGLAAACEARTCECEPSANRACSGTGAESFCQVPTAGAPACVECRDSSDCSGAKAECVDNRCAECSSKRKSAGCSGDTPICDPGTNTCKPCSMNPDDCGGTLKCTAGGACGGCANSTTDCLTPNTPICDSGTTQCRGCAADDECVAERGQPFCIDQERCATCKPTTKEGCDDPAKPDCRFDTNGGLACLPCTSDDQCKGRAATPVCNTTTGHCVECTSGNDCTGNAKKPLCAGNSCVACDSSAVTGDADALCTEKPDHKVACVRSGTQKGECGACNPGDSKPCTSAELCCETGGIAGCIATSAAQCTACGTPCNPDLANTCTNRGCGCGSGAACSGTGSQRVCVGSPGTCAGCANNGDCTDPAAPLCDPATATCVNCVDNGSCDDASTKPICGSNVCRKCASDEECAALGGAAGPLCGSNGACGADAACTADTECTDGRHGQCVDIGSGVERCRACDPDNGDGCGASQACVGFVCVP